MTLARQASVRRLMPALVLLAAMIVGLATATPVRAAEPLSDELVTAMHQRGIFGLRNDADYVAELMNSDLPDIHGWEGLYLTAEEVKDLGLNGRMTFAVALDKAVRPYLNSVDTLGGYWIDQAHGGRLVVGLTSLDEKVMDHVRDLMPSDSLGLRFVKVASTLTDLRSAVKKVDEKWDEVVRLDPPVSYAVDESENAIDIGVVKRDLDAAHEKMGALSKVLGVAVHLHKETPGNDLACSVRIDCGSIHSGVLIERDSEASGYRCTVGFIVYVPGSDVPYQFLTAGHCARKPSGSGYTWGQTDYWHGRPGHLVGTLKKNDLYVSGHIDVERVGINGGASAITEQILGDDPPFHIQNERSPIQGEGLCTSLANTDYTTSSDGMKCGTVATTNTYWESDYGPWRVHGSAMDLVSSSGPIGGDSGGPVYDKTYVHEDGQTYVWYYAPVGIIDHERIPDDGNSANSQGDPTDHPGHDLYFAEVKEILDEWTGASIWKN